MSTPKEVFGADDLVPELVSVLGRQHCFTDPEITASFTTDWTGRYSGEATAVVMPSTTEQVAAVLAIADRHGVAVIPQGGNTGLVGGSVPRGAAPVGLTAGSSHRPRRQLVLSLRSLSGVARIDRSSGLLEAGGGTPLAMAQAEASAAGFHLGIDLGARDSATLGGMAATNAGGLQVHRYGSMRARLAGLEAVLADGTTVSHMSGLAKDSVGWDPAGLLVGSEGTLGIITRVLVRMERLARHRVAVVAALTDAAAAIDLVQGPLRTLSSLEAAELTLTDGMELVCHHAQLTPPVGSTEGAKAWLTLEAAGSSDPSEELARALDDSRVLATAVATDAATRARLWAYRERHPDAVSSLGVPHKFDVAVTPSRLAHVLAALPGLVTSLSAGARLIVWGHVAEGNLHVNVVGPPAEDYAVDDAVLDLVLSLGGSISAEHGIGIAKVRWLSAARPTGTLELMARVKRALDPAGILNPGVLEPS
ncbi:MAG: FAD-binding oxidoreductase [Acidimicrobiales bacterium]